MKAQRALKISIKLDLEGIDWDAAGNAWLWNEGELVLTYFTDIAGQTVMYMRDSLHTTGVGDSEVIVFFLAWNYEEYFHGEALCKVHEVCGIEPELNPISEVRRKATSKENSLTWLTSKVSRLLNECFWSPAGAGVKTKEEVARLFFGLFGDEDKDALIEKVGQKGGQPLSMDGIKTKGSWFATNLPPLVLKSQCG